jgi:hypothetical protein
MYHFGEGEQRGDLIDHVFMLVEADGPEMDSMGSLGLVETYRRTHPGQGTQNVCYCFDNLYLELIWVNDKDAVRSNGIQRTGLYERSLWRTKGTCPFGIAWRKCEGQPASALPTWEFTPPYLPKGMSIKVATDSDDPRQPMMFESPGSSPPIEWPIEKRGNLQHSIGLGAVTEIRLTMPTDAAPSSALKGIAQSDDPPVRIEPIGAYCLHLRIASLISKPDLQIALPLLS